MSVCYEKGVFESIVFDPSKHRRGFFQSSVTSMLPGLSHGSMASDGGIRGHRGHWRASVHRMLCMVQVSFVCLVLYMLPIITIDLKASTVQINKYQHTCNKKANAIVIFYFELFISDFCILNRLKRELTQSGKLFLFFIYSIHLNE